MATCRLPFLFLIKVEKRWLYLNYLLHQTFEVATFQTSGLVNLVFSHQTGSFECEHLFIDKPMVPTERAKAKTWLLGLGSKLHPSNMQCMLHKDLTQFMESLSRVRVHLCWQGDLDTEVSLCKNVSALADYYFLFVMYCVPVISSNTFILVQLSTLSQCL